MQSEDDGHTADPVMVLTHEFWRRVFGSDPDVVGRTFRMNGRSVTVIGVLEPVPHFPERTDVFVNTVTSPHHMSAAMTDDRQHRMTQVFARLAPGSSLEAATAELDGIAARLAREYPEAYVDVPGARVSITTLEDELTVRARPTLFALLATGGFALLIACANVANLTVSRTLRREKELALRSALGAGRSRLRWLLLSENLLLALAGVVVGVVFTKLSWNLLVNFAARFTPRASEIALDGLVLGFTVAIAVAAAVVSALAPPLPTPGTGTGAGMRATGGAHQRALQRGLVVAQLAVSFVLLVGAGLLVRTLQNLQRVDTGFAIENILSMEIPLSRGGRTLDQSPGHVVYQPFDQEPWAGGLLVRSRVDPPALAPQLAGIVRGLVADQPVENVKTLRELRAETLGPERLNAALIGGFAVLAALIAAVGVFGVLAFSVSQRTQEFGVRLSFGADTASLRRLVLGEGFRIQLVALLLGVVASLGLAQFLRGFLFGVEPVDPITLVSVAALLTVVALVAAWAPAERASRVEPVEVLRVE